MEITPDKKLAILNQHLERVLSNTRGMYSSISLINDRGVWKYEGSINSLQIKPEEGGVSIVGKARVDQVSLRVERTPVRFEIPPTALEFSSEDSPPHVVEAEEYLRKKSGQHLARSVHGFKSSIAGFTQKDWAENIIPRYFVKEGSISDDYRQDLLRRAGRNGMELEERVLEVLFGSIDHFNAEIIAEFYSQ